LLCATPQLRTLYSKRYLSKHKEEIPNNSSGHKISHAFYWHLCYHSKKNCNFLLTLGHLNQIFNFRTDASFIFPPKTSFFCTFISYTCFLFALHQLFVHSVIIYLPFLLFFLLPTQVSSFRSIHLLIPNPT